MAQPDEELGQLLDVLHAVEDAAGRFGEIFQQAQVGLIGSDAHGGDRNPFARQIGNQQVVFVILAIGIAVGQQDDLAHRQAAYDQVSRRDFQRFLEIGAAAGLQAQNLLLELSAIHAQRMQTRNHVGLRIERDNPDVVAVVELAQQAQSRPAWRSGCARRRAPPG